MKIKELFTDKDKWCKKHESINQEGEEVSIHNPKAVRWCLVGSIYKCYAHNYVDIINKIEFEIGPINISTWNDSPKRTFQDIVDLVNKLDI